MRPLTHNQYGFSVADDNPFAIFKYLQRVARGKIGQANVIDLSRGDPGYFFTSSERARRFFGYLVFLDTVLNNRAHRFVEYAESDFETIWRTIETATRESFSPEVAKEFFEDWEMVFEKIPAMAAAQGLSYSRFSILQNLFKCGTISGSCYGDPQGEEMARVIVGSLYAPACNFEDLIFTNGASHAIGTTFKLLGVEGIGYLQPGDRVVISSPVYSPYNSILKNRGLTTISFSVDPMTGAVSEESRKRLLSDPGPVKAVLIVDPNNPTGFSLPESFLQELAAFAKKKNALVITDEVYLKFFPPKKTMVDFCPERVLCISSRSKIERSTGLRFGELVLPKAANDYLSRSLLKPYLKQGYDLKKAFMNAKGPGGITGDLQHTTFVPPPAQYLGALHIVLGEEEQKLYREAVFGNRDIFYKVLGLPHQGNLYYVIFDLNELSGRGKKEVPIEQKLLDLAARGVVYIPACKFFSEEDQKQRDLSNMVRASIVNTTQEKIRQAAEITKMYLHE